MAVREESMNGKDFCRALSREVNKIKKGILQTTPHSKLKSVTDFE